MGAHFLLGAEERRYHSAVKVGHGVALHVQNPAAELHLLAGPERRHIIGVNRFAVDGLDLGRIGSPGQAHCRVTEAEESAFIVGGRRDGILGQSQDVAHTARAAILVGREDPAPHFIGQHTVGGNLGQTRGTQDGDCTAVGVQEDALATGEFGIVKARIFTRGGIQHRQMTVVELRLDVRAHHQALAGPVLGAGMADVVPPQDALLQGREQLGTGIGISARATSAHGIEGIDIDAVKDDVAATVGAGVAYHHRVLRHVYALVLIVSHMQGLVLPRPIGRFAHIVHHLVDHGAGLTGVLDDHASHGNVHHVLKVPVIGAGTVLQNAEVVVGRDRVVVVGTQLALPGQQVGVVQQVGISSDQAVVIAATTQQQQVAQTVAVLALATVIEHLAQATVGHGVLGAAGELVEDLLVVQHEHAETVKFLMQVGQSISLLQIGTGRENDHVGGGFTVDVLIGYLIQVFGVKEGARLVEDDKLLTAVLHRAEGHRAIAGNDIELDQGIRGGHVPHVGGAATLAHAVTLAGTGIIQAEGELLAAQCQLALIVDGDKVKAGQSHLATAAEIQAVIQLGGPVQGEGLDRTVPDVAVARSVAVDEVMDMGSFSDLPDTVGPGHWQCSAIDAVGNGAVHTRHIGAKEGVGLHLAATHQSVKVKLEQLVPVALEVLAQEIASRLAGIDILQLVVEALGIGRHNIAGGPVGGLSDLDVFEAAVVGHQVAGGPGIGVLHLQLLDVTGIVHMPHVTGKELPRHGSLGIEQDAVAGTHHGNLGQVVGIVVAQHHLAQRLATVAEHVNLCQVRTQAPAADVIGRYLIDAALGNADLDPLAAGKDAVVGIVTLVERTGSEHATGH